MVTVVPAVSKAQRLPSVNLSAKQFIIIFKVAVACTSAVLQVILGIHFL